jgi:hypothetical protein
MATSQFEYWKAGAEERRIRIFVSHRYGKDQELYSEVFRALERNGHAVQDVSLSADQILKGPRGGRMPRMRIQAEIAARIYTADIVIAPSRVGAGQSEWITWEVQLAAVGYGVPVLFIHQPDQKNAARLVSEVRDLGLPHAVCAAEAHHIVRNVTTLIDGHPDWSFRQDETDRLIRFRGPPAFARETVLNKLPLTARLAALDEAALPPRKRGLWGLFRGG